MDDLQNADASRSANGSNEIHTLPPLELSAWRRDRAIGRLWWLRFPAELTRTFARCSAPIAFLVSASGFVCFPDGSNWSTEKIFAFEVIGIGGGFAALSVVGCLIAWCLTPFSSTARQRPLWPSFSLNAASFVLNVITPAT